MNSGHLQEEQSLSQLPLYAPNSKKPLLPKPSRKNRIKESMVGTLAPNIEREYNIYLIMDHILSLRAHERSLEIL